MGKSCGTLALEAVVAECKSIISYVGTASAQGVALSRFRVLHDKIDSYIKSNDLDRKNPLLEASGTTPESISAAASPARSLCDTGTQIAILACLAVIGKFDVRQAGQQYMQQSMVMMSRLDECNALPSKLMLDFYMIAYKRLDEQFCTFEESQLAALQVVSLCLPHIGAACRVDTDIQMIFVMMRRLSRVVRSTSWTSLRNLACVLIHQHMTFCQTKFSHGSLLIAKFSCGIVAEIIPVMCHTGRSALSSDALRSCFNVIYLNIASLLGNIAGDEHVRLVDASAGQALLRLSNLTMHVDLDVREGLRDICLKLLRFVHESVPTICDALVQITALCLGDKSLPNGKLVDIRDLSSLEVRLFLRTRIRMQLKNELHRLTQTDAVSARVRSVIGLARIAGATGWANELLDEESHFALLHAVQSLIGGALENDAIPDREHIPFENYLNEREDRALNESHEEFLFQKIENLVSHFALPELTITMRAMPSVPATTKASWASQCHQLQTCARAFQMRQAQRTKTGSGISDKLSILRNMTLLCMGESDTEQEETPSARSTVLGFCRLQTYLITLEVYMTVDKYCDILPFLLSDILALQSHKNRILQCYAERCIRVASQLKPYQNLDRITSKHAPTTDHLTDAVIHYVRHFTVDTTSVARLLNVLTTLELRSSPALLRWLAIILDFCIEHNQDVGLITSVCHYVAAVCRTFDSPESSGTLRRYYEDEKRVVTVQDKLHPSRCRQSQPSLFCIHFCERLQTKSRVSPNTNGATSSRHEPQVPPIDPFLNGLQTNLGEYVTVMTSLVVTDNGSIRIAAWRLLAIFAKASCLRIEGHIWLSVWPPLLTFLNDMVTNIDHLQPCDVQALQEALLLALLLTKQALMPAQSQRHDFILLLSTIEARGASKKSPFIGKGLCSMAKEIREGTFSTFQGLRPLPSTKAAPRGQQSEAPTICDMEKPVEQDTKNTQKSPLWGAP